MFLPSATKLQQGNAFIPVCHSVHRGVFGRHPLVDPGQTHPSRTDTPGQTPPGQTPPGQTPTPRHTLPPDRHPLGRHPTPIRQTAPWADPPPLHTPPFPGKHPSSADTPGRRLLQWTVGILLECILVLDNFFLIKFNKINNSKYKLMKFPFRRSIFV